MLDSRPLLAMPGWASNGCWAIRRKCLLDPDGMLDQARQEPESLMDATLRSCEATSHQMWITQGELSANGGTPTILFARNGELLGIDRRYWRMLGRPKYLFGAQAGPLLGSPSVSRTTYVIMPITI